MPIITAALIWNPTDSLRLVHIAIAAAPEDEGIEPHFSTAAIGTLAAVQPYVDDNPMAVVNGYCTDTPLSLATQAQSQLPTAALLADILNTAVHRIGALLAWMEGGAVVRPYVASRQVRRAAERKGAGLPELEVVPSPS